MSTPRTLHRGEAVALSSLSASQRSPGALEVRVGAHGAAPDVVALLLGPDGRVRSDRDLVFFNQPASAGGAVRVDTTAATARIDTAAVEDQVARVLVGCAGGPLDADRPTTLRIDIAHPGSGVLASAVVEVPAGHRAENLLEVYRWGNGWRLRVLGDGYASGLEGLVRDHGVQVEAPASAPVPSTSVWPTPAPAAAPPSWSANTPAWSPNTSPAWSTNTPAPPPPPAPRRRAGRRRGVALVGAGLAALVAVIVAVSLAGGSGAKPPQRAAGASSGPATTAAAPSESSTPSVTVLAAPAAAAVPAAAAAQAELAALPVKGRAPMTGYDRSAFGQAWADVDRNGCDTRNDVLRRDVAGASIDPTTNGCVVLSGQVADPYSGTTIPFTRGASTSADVQIDHVVALGNAWVTGAQAFDAAKRQRFANDPANLLAVDGSLNAQKGDGDAATWLPPNKPFRCSYVAMQVQVKRAYGLWVTAPERDAIARILATCPGATTPPAPTTAAPTTTAPAPPPVVVTTPPTTPPPPDDPGSVYYKNCDAVRAAGKAPLYRGDPGYRSGLDRDGDGIACE